MPTPVRYTSDEEDSGRWIGFPFRPGDIVISTRSKSGTTWMQMICALLVFRSSELPAPLSALSPWLDRLTEPQAQVYAGLEAQRHRRFIKTHTPLDGIPIDPAAYYIVVARNPLDMAVSLYHQGENINRERLRELTGGPAVAERQRPDLHEWLVRWSLSNADPREAMDSLPGVLHHLADAWKRRHEPNILLIHYDDLKSDLNAAMRRIAARLNVQVPNDRWPTLVEAATFAAMRDRATTLVPDTQRILKDPQAFFRQGRSGAGAELLTPGELASYHEHAGALAPADMLTWLHR
jgi:aryl sulfotransferase